ncbi:MAG: 23S rRNA (adenine(2503)-C(2))-methyltransferase RlmN [Candidatus Eisenbacteria bacterium]|nr:23S rRNA (adenine(2503)-C(2))-methyltransferase RlmN [Candidatus Eisenbacteria bacterium]
MWVGLLPSEIEERLRPLGVPGYRALQVFRWVHRHGARDFEAMTNLPRALRETLAAAAPIGIPAVAARSEPGADGSLKILFRFPEGTETETVRIAGADGLTACVSSQAGCRYGCAYCATPLGGFERSLRAGEIAGQVLGLGETVRRVVYMGMGEPLANYAEVVKSVRLLVHPHGLALPARRITISTVGLVPLIRRLAEEGLGVRLAISLASAIDETRARLLPIARTYDLDSLFAAAARFSETSGSRVTFEYVLLGGVNDGEEDARALIRRLSPLRCKLNLIPYNPVDDLPFGAPAEHAIDRFLARLAPHLTVTVRRSAGRTIDAACGQLRLRARAASPGEPKR